MLAFLRTAMVPVLKAGLAAVGFGLSLYVARSLGSAAFGIYAAATTTVVVFAGIIQHVADAVYLRAVDGLPEGEEGGVIRANGLLRLIGAAASILLILLGLGTAALLGRTGPFTPTMVALICVGVAATVAMSIPQIVHQSRQHFRRYLTIDIAMYGLRVVGLAGLTLANGLTLMFAFALHVLAPAVAIFGSPARIGPSMPPPRIRVEMVRMIRLARWIGAAFVFSILTSKLDLLMLAFLVPPSETGLYAAALNLAIVAEFAGAFLLVVYYPRILEWYRLGRLRAVLMQFLLVAVPLAVAAAWLGVLYAEPIILTIFGPAFAGSAPLFAVLLPCALFMMVVQPVAAPFINLRAPHVLCAVEAIGLAVAVVGIAFAVSRFGAVGAAWAIVIVRSAVGAFILLWALVRARPDELPATLRTEPLT